MKKRATILTLLLMGATPLFAAEGWSTDVEQVKAARMKTRSPVRPPSWRSGKSRPTMRWIC